MKKINESLNEIQGLTEYLKDREVNEGIFSDALNFIKKKFQNAWTYLKGLVAKVGSYILPVSKTGLVLPAITPLTAGQAYVDGHINKKSTFIVMDKEGAKITGCKNKLDDAVKLYGDTNPIKYWEQLINESQDTERINAVNEAIDKYLETSGMINEVKMHTEDPEAEFNIIDDDDALRDRIAMCLDNPELARLLIWGAPGIGKTAILLKVIAGVKASHPDYRLIIKTLSNETPDNFMLPAYVEEFGDDDFANLAKELNKEESWIKKLFKATGMTKATDVPKTWLPVYKPTGDKDVDKHLDEKCGKGLLFIDELSRATDQVLNVILPLVNEGNFNGYVLGSGWTLVCASNRTQDEEGGQAKIGNALANRFLQVFFEPTVKSWEKWAKDQKFISPLLIQWLSLGEKSPESGAKYFYMDPNEDPNMVAPTTLMCTPRSWTNAMRRLAVYDHTLNKDLSGFNILKLPDSIIQAALNEAIPKQAVKSFVAFLSIIRSIGDMDSAVADIWKNGGKNFKLDKKDLRKIALPLAQLICTAHADKLPTPKEWENLCTWITTQKSDQLASYVLDVFGNTFLSDIDPTLQGQWYRFGARVEKFGKDHSSVKQWVNEFKPWSAKWGVDPLKMGNYYPGLKILIDTYGASFNNAVVGDHEAALA